MLFIFCVFSVSMFAQKDIAPKPLYDDPVYHGAADPVIIYNKQIIHLKIVIFWLLLLVRIVFL